MITTWTTNRLVARALNYEHLNDLHLLHTDEHVMKVLNPNGGRIERRKTQELIEDAHKHWQHYGYGFWMFYSKEKGEFVGRSGIKNYPLVEFQGQIICGIAYATLSDYWRMGYAQEMCEGILQIAFGQLELETLSGWALPNNLASINLLEKLQFRYMKNIIFADLPHSYYELARKHYHA